MTCGQGVSVKSRLLLVSGENHTNCVDKVVLEEARTCNGTRPTCEIDASLARGKRIAYVISTSLEPLDSYSSFRHFEKLKNSDGTTTERINIMSLGSIVFDWLSETRLKLCV